MNITFIKTLSLALLLASTGFLVACSGSKQEPTAKANSNQQEAAQAIEVSTTQVVERSARRGFEVLGGLEAQDEVTLSNKAEGILVEIGVDIGSPVRHGQVIGRIDPVQLRIRVEQAEAAVRQAEAKLGIKPGEKFDPERQSDVRSAKSALERARYDRDAAQALVEKGDISKQQVDVYQRTFEQAEARYETALENVRNMQAQLEEKRATLTLAKQQLSDTEIISSINGVVQEKTASRGEFLKVGSPVVTVVQINPLRLKLPIPEAFAASVKPGLMVRLKVDAFPDREFEGRVRRINPSVNEQNRSLIIEAEVANSSGGLRPGMFARGQIFSDSDSTMLMVPEKAVVSIAGVNKVFVVSGDRASERLVKLGAREGSMVEILEGIKQGERVITSQTDKIQDGAQVTAPAS